MILAILALGVGVQVLAHFGVTGIGLLYLLIPVFLFLLSSYYALSVKFGISTIVLVLLALGFIAWVFKIQHYQGASALRLADLVGQGILMGILIWTAFKNGQDRIMLSILAAAIAFPLMAVGFDYNMGSAIKTSVYLVLAIVATLKLKRTTLETGLSKVLNITLLQAVLYVIRDCAWWFN